MHETNTTDTSQHDYRLTAALEALEKLGATSDPFLTMTVLELPSLADPGHLDLLTESHPCEETDYLVELWAAERS